MVCLVKATHSAAGLRLAQKPRQQTVATRRQFGVQLLSVGVGLLGLTGASYAQENATSTDTPSPGPSNGPTRITISPVNKEAKSYLDMRDEAMEYQCKGGMFDCDGDRREFAHKQYMDWLSAGGVPKRIRDGKPEGPKSY